MRWMNGAALRSAFVMLAWAMCGQVLAEDGVEDPHFAMPVMKGSNALCSTQSVEVRRTRADTVMSIVRSGKARPLVEVKGGARKQDSASCVIDVRFQTPLEEARTMGIDFIGVEHKTPGASASLTVTLGTQKHVFDYPRGRVLDASIGPVTKRFQMIDLPAGTRHVKVAIAAKASRKAYHDSATVGFDAMDFCFISPEEQPEFCGAPGYPNPRVMP